MESIDIYKILEILAYAGVGYAILYTGSKIIFSLLSLIEIKRYFNRYDHIIDEDELNEHLTKNHHELPMVSIISPAYNEGVLIIDTVSSFLHQSYKNKEVIICSDGGTDQTLEKLIEHFELVEVDDTFERSKSISFKPIKRFFKSSNPAYKDLIVLDKENGGKADAQNAGVAIARGEIVTIIDADSILEKYALIHLTDIFEREPNVIGIGTPIGVVNDCNIGPDGVDDASVPKSFWAKIQVIEYLRSFLLGRMFAQRYRGLQIVSGAFGVYRKWILEAVNGYSTGSLAEDMDIDGKIWRYIDSNKLKDRIRYIPEAFCWSEVPNTFKSLAIQRDRWSRGMSETIWKNKDLFFNPRYKMLGLFSYPYYVFFEWLTPFIEIGGLLYVIIGTALGWFSVFLLEEIFLIYWIVGIVLNIVALSVEAFTRGHYKNRMTLLKLSFFAILEPLFYHWINSFIYVLANFKLVILRKKGWGKMDRVGLTKVQPAAVSVIIPSHFKEKVH
jgi:cellulose synthase/poly-beta-1,6-N-acetylglucosamine synthase-like glycosyltransferase